MSREKGKAPGRDSKHPQPYHRRLEYWGRRRGKRKRGNSKEKGKSDRMRMGCSCPPSLGCDSFVEVSVGRSFPLSLCRGLGPSLLPCFLVVRFADVPAILPRVTQYHGRTCDFWEIYQHLELLPMSTAEYKWEAAKKPSTSTVHESFPL